MGLVCQSTDGTSLVGPRRGLCVMRAGGRTLRGWLASVQALGEATLDILHSLPVFVYPPNYKDISLIVNFTVPR